MAVAFVAECSAALGQIIFHLSAQAESMAGANGMADNITWKSASVISGRILPTLARVSST
jgi:hypothetical protein